MGIEFRIKQQLDRHKLIGNILIDLFDNIEFEKDIHEKSIDQILEAYRSYSNRCSNPEIVLTSLSIIALKSYDGNFWSHVQTEYSWLYNRASKQGIESAIRTILRRSRPDIVEGRQINFPIIQSIVPVVYLPSFFEFIFDIYKINFQHELSDNLENDFEFIYDSLAGSINENIDDIELDVTKKTYKLIKTTKEIIKLRIDFESLIKLSISILKIIDSNYWNEPKNILLENTYFSEGFEKWVKLNFGKESLVKGKETQRPSISSRWLSGFKYENKKIYLKTPELKIKSKYNPTEVSIGILNDGKLIYSDKKPPIFPIVGGYRIPQQTVRIDSPLGRVQYVLLCGEEEIYNSKSELFRDYLMFETSGSEIKNNTNHDDKEIIFCFLGNPDPNFTVFYSSDEYRLGTVISDPSKQYVLGRNIITLCSIHNPGIIGIPCEKAKAIIDNEMLKVFFTVEKFVVETELFMDDLAVMVNGKREKLTKENATEKKRGPYNNIEIIMNEAQSGRYQIDVFEIATGKTIPQGKFHFIIDKNFSFISEPKNKLNYEFLVSSAFNLFDDFGKATEIFSLDLSQKSEMAINTEFDEESKGQYVLLLDIPLYQIDDKKWMIFDQPLWHKNVGFYSKMKVKGLEVNSVELLDSQKNRILDLSFLKNDETNEINLGIIKNFDLTSDLLFMKFTKNGFQTGIIAYFVKCQYDEKNSFMDFDSENGVLSIITSYFGEGLVKTIIFDSKGNEVYNQKVEESGSVNEVKNIFSFEEYIIQIVEEPSTLLGQKRVMFERRQIFYKNQDFIGKSFQIDRITLERPSCSGNSFSNQKVRFENSFVLFTKHLSEKKYQGRIFQVFSSEKQYLLNFDPVEIELIGEIEKRATWCAITSDGDGLYLDYPNRTILDKEFDREAQDIYEYHILIRGDFNEKNESN